MKSLFTIIYFCSASIMVFSQGASLPYYTGFDSPQEQAGWLEYRTGVLSLEEWNYVGNPYSVPTSLGHDYNVGGSGTDTVIDWFVSPPLNFTSQGKIDLKVYTDGFSTPIPDNCEIWFGTGNQNPSTGSFLFIGNISYMQPQLQWLDTNFRIPFISDSGYIAIKYKTIGAAWMTYSIDNITVSIDTTASVEENRFNSSPKLFPNPFNISTTVYIDKKPVSSPVDLNMTDVFGRLVKQIKDITTNQININRENLSNGIYFIRLMSGNKLIESQKVIIQ